MYTLQGSVTFKESNDFKVLLNISSPSIDEAYSVKSAIQESKGRLLIQVVRHPSFRHGMQKQISVFKKHIYFWLWSSIWDEIKMDFTMKFLYFLKLQFNLYWGENWENFIKIIANNSFHNNSLNVICSWLIYLHVQMLHETWFIINKLWNEILACKEKLFYSMLYLLVHKVNLCHFSLRKKSAAP